MIYFILKYFWFVSYPIPLFIIYSFELNFSMQLKRIKFPAFRTPLQSISEFDVLGTYKVNISTKGMLSLLTYIHQADLSHSFELKIPSFFLYIWSITFELGSLKF